MVLLNKTVDKSHDSFFNLWFFTQVLSEKIITWIWTKAKIFCLDSDERIKMNTFFGLFLTKLSARTPFNNLTKGNLIISVGPMLNSISNWPKTTKINACLKHWKNFRRNLVFFFLSNFRAEFHGKESNFLVKVSYKQIIVASLIRKHYRTTQDIDAATTLLKYFHSSGNVAFTKCFHLFLAANNFRDRSFWAKQTSTFCGCTHINPINWPQSSKH